MELDTARFPDEVLNIIIQECCPGYNTVAYAAFHNLPRKQNWISCSCVCRRWYRITFPHSFRYIRLGGSSGLDMNTASRFLSFIREKPSIAPVIQEIIFKKIVVDIDLLRSILVALPGLRYIVFINALIPGLPYETMPIAHKIHRIAYVGGHCDSSDYDDSDFPSSVAVCKSQVSPLLRLFPAIEELQVLCHCQHSDYLRPDEHLVEPEDGTPPIHSLNINVDLQFSVYFNALHELHFLKHLTCLHLAQCSLRYIEAEINFVLQIVGRSLLELSLSVNSCTSPSSDFTLQSAKEIAEKLDGGISACSSLHGFRLELIMLTHHYPTIGDQQARDTLDFGILIGIELIALVQPTRLKHLSFLYRPAFPPGTTLANVHNIEFSNLGSVHRRFANLRSLTLDVHDITTDSHIQREFIQCARGELEGFKGRFYHREPGSFFRCDEPSCAWSSGGKLNRYLTLDREINEP